MGEKTFKVKEERKTYVDIVYAHNKKVEGYILDISKTGIGIASPIRIKKNTRIHIVPKSETLLALEGKVIYIAKIKNKGYNYKVGAELMRLNELQGNSIDEFIFCSDRRKFYRLKFI